jgi:hypothetical protein
MGWKYSQNVGEGPGKNYILPEWLQRGLGGWGVHSVYVQTNTAKVSIFLLKGKTCKVLRSGVFINLLL